MFCKNKAKRDKLRGSVRGVYRDTVVVLKSTNKNVGKRNRRDRFLSQNPHYYSLDLDLTIWFRVLKLQGLTFEKGGPRFSLGLERTAGRVGSKRHKI